MLNKTASSCSNPSQSLSSPIISSVISGKLLLFSCLCAKSWDYLYLLPLAASTVPEDELGAKLLHRTTRTVTLTPAGISFLEDAKNVIRRFMWHMNEESGNIGWGIPEAFGEALAQSRPLADDFYRVLFSYVRAKEGDNTWCDYAPLRLSCYRAVERVMQARPDLRHEALCILHNAKDDPDPACRELARELFEAYRSAPGETAKNTFA